MDTLIRFMTALLAIILLLLFPLQYIAQSQDETIQAAVHTHVQEFTETARKQGYISLNMYEKLEEKLDYTGELYELSLTVSHPVTAQQPDLSRVNDKISGLRSLGTRSSLLNGRTRLLTARSHTDLVENESNILTSISVSPPSQSVKRYSIPAFTVTAHYEDGTSNVITSGYDVTGLNNENLGLQTVYISYTENDISKNITVEVTFTKLTTTCQVCGTTYELDDNDTDRGCPVCGSKVIQISATPYRVTVNRGEELPIAVTATYQNGTAGNITGWTSNYDPNFIEIRKVEIEYLGLKNTITVETLPGKITCPLCDNPYDLNPDGTDPGCPTCRKEVTGIKITEDSITIDKFDPLPITVTATYKDNHSGIVDDWATDFIPDREGSYEAAVFYRDFSDTVIVNVRNEDEITCPICGTVYDKSENPNGCPVCSITLTGIEARLRSGGTQVIYKSEIKLEITLIYRDGHQTIVNSGYTISGYHSETLGFQNILVHYDELTTTLRIEIIKGPARVICPKGHEYYLNEDGTDPGCPFCEGYDKDEVITYFDAAYTPEIVRVLAENGEYRLKKGDYLTVTIISRDASVRSRLRKMLFGTNSGIVKKKYTYGGEVY